jgi:hypothetical protein
LQMVFPFQVFWLKFWINIPSVPVPDGCPAHLIFSDLTNLIIFVKKVPILHYYNCINVRKREKLWTRLCLLPRAYVTRQGLVLWDLL